MKEIYNIDEIFLMADRLEEDGAKYYRSMAEKMKDDDVKSLLLGLALMEDSHRAVFSAMRKKFVDNGIRSVDPSGEAAAFLSALADSGSFSSKMAVEKISKKELSVADVLKMAIDMEKDSIVFYIGLKDLVPETLGKDKIGKIIKEEMNHICTLTNEMNAL